MEKVSETIRNFVNFIEDIPSEHDKCLMMDDQLLKKIRDFEHTLELDTELKYRDFAKIGKEIGEVRRKRREYKDRALTISPIVQFLVENKDIIKQLNRLASSIEVNENLLVDRIYNEKCSIDTEDLINTDCGESTDCTVRTNTLKLQLSSIISEQIKSFTINTSDYNENHFNVIIQHSKISKPVCRDIVNAIISRMETKLFKNNYISKTFSDSIHTDNDNKKYCLSQIHVYGENNANDMECVLDIKFMEKKL